MLGSGYQNNMGAVVGYGVALQASCLEGFDSLGLHQTMVLSSNGKMVARLATHVGSNPTGTTKHLPLPMDWEQAF